MTSRQSDRPSRWSAAKFKKSGWARRFRLDARWMVEAEKATRELSDVAAKIAVELPK